MTRTIIRQKPLQVLALFTALASIVAPASYAAGENPAAAKKSTTTKKSEPVKTTGKSKSTPAAPVLPSAADANINAEAFNAVLLSKMVFDLTNAERRKAGLPLFEANQYLAGSATAHSQDMASRAYFAHKSKGLLSRTDPRDRVQSLGYNPGMVAENIAMVPTYTGQTIQTYPGNRGQVVSTNFNTYRSLAETAVREWMNSPGHRENILNGRLTSLGIGVAVGINKNVPYVYLTQNFGG